MTVIRFLRLLNKNLNLLLLCSLALAIVVFLFTRNLPKTYESKTEIYTGLASGPSVDAINGARLDWMATSNEFDNLIYVIKSEQTLGEVGEKLLARHLLMIEDEKTPNVLNETTMEILDNILPQEIRDTMVVPGSLPMTLQNINRLREKYATSWTARTIFQNSGSPYSYSALSGITVRRINNSDLIQVSYSWMDPHVVKHTLDILNDVFAKKLLDIKIGQTNDIVRYYEDQVEEARINLASAEDELKNFRIENKVINFDQQTKNIAQMQGQLESQYQEELRAKAAAQSRVDQLENSMELNKKMLEFNEDLLKKRRQLADIRSEIAKMEVYYNDEEELADLREKADVLEAELKNNVSQRLQYSKTKEGVDTRSVISQWLSAVLELDATKARLSVLSNRSDYFQDAYNEFSPLGSELNRLDRAVDIAEKKYLDLNHSLNMAMTRQQSESISTGGIVVTVPPKLPLEAIKSKQLLLVLVAAVIGFILPLALLLLIEFLDTTVRTPIRGEELTGLKLLGAFPDLTPLSEFKNVNMEWLQQKSVGHLIQNLRLESRKHEEVGIKTKNILIFSTRNNEGKDLITDVMARQLVDLDKKVLVIRYKDFEQHPQQELGPVPYTEHIYTYGNQFLKKNSIDELLPASLDQDDYDFVFLEIRGVIRDQYPIELMERFEMGVCVVSAKRSWNKADRFALSEFMETLKFQPRLVINAVEPDYMDSVLGEIEKTRSSLRKFLKAVLTLQFKSNVTKRKKKKEKVKKVA